MTRTSPSGSRTGLRRAALALTVSASALALVGTTVPAHATLVTSKYLLAASGYGTRITSPEVGLQSGPTSYSVIGCAKASGISEQNQLNATDLNGQVQVGTVKTWQRSMVSQGSSISRSVTTVASADLGSSTFGLRITGLRSISDARANPAGKLSASNEFTFASIAPRGALTLPAPLTQPADVILRSLVENGPLTIPGFGRISLGESSTTAGASYARATGAGMLVHLFGSDGLDNTNDDSDVNLTRSYALISKQAPYGVLTGGSWGVDATALGGLTTVGRNPFSSVHCQGTGGRVQTESLAGLNLAGQNQLVLNNLRNRVYGKQGLPRGGVTAWDESTLSSANLGGGALRISGIRAYAKVVRTSANRYTPTSAQSIAAITVNGTTQRVPSPGQSITIPNVARVEVPRPVKRVNGVKVTAVRITLLGGSAANTVINLGNAEVYARGR
jgi:hypothetical protein